MTSLVTGVAGFIGFHLARRLLQQEQPVVGLDNVNDYYDVSLKQARLSELNKLHGFRFVRLDIAERDELDKLFAASKFDVVINLAAQAGVRYSLVNPHAYIRSNIDGFVNILEACRHSAVRHLIYASSSSVYGAVTKMPFSVHQNVDHPISIYGASKKANELLAHSYSHLFGLPTTGLRFFTVYGPWGRPDMALFIFTRAILANEPIQIFNHGRMARDFTYIDDIVEGVVRLVDRLPTPKRELERRQSGSCDQCSALSGLQHRKPSPRERDAPGRGFGELPRPKGSQAVPADAARRRPGDLCRRR
jgi:UDP-glucuronate 4-epimerase